MGRADSGIWYWMEGRVLVGWQVDEAWLDVVGMGKWGGVWHGHGEHGSLAVGDLLHLNVSMVGGM
ncbi:hypothetical protein JD969_10145 [Planctomycetota bacterium]|nr:hypothetical protein JD969_10145 [Planctomycetota bacterium]